MRHLALTALLVATLAALSGVVTYRLVRGATPAAPEDDALTWIRREFAVDGARLARVRTLHEAYAGVCEEHCAAILRSRATLRRLEADGAGAEVIEAARTEARRLDAVCRGSLEVHVREVAALIGGAHGERYLAAVLPRIARFEHEGPPDLQLKTRLPHAHDGHRAP
jgi:hypothetical protein